ncbi:hypothetical protein SASPL_151157 [Salvia splendens]|uniref:Uncharacterized protein n=1 Tax=Salvia splendens TaxID=180675 RepID=A0A8X8Z3B9_SALSN|nr:hypothetical protein SASPL_151157 [Salvia splendens]
MHPLHLAASTALGHGCLRFGPPAARPLPRVPAGKHAVGERANQVSEIIQEESRRAIARPRNNPERNGKRSRKLLRVPSRIHERPTHNSNTTYLFFGLYTARKRILVGAASGDKPRLIKGGDVQSRKHQRPRDSFWNSVWSDRLLRVRKLCEDKVRLSASVVHLQLFPAQSRMYGQAGGVSAIIGALLILGRKTLALLANSPIARITETFIGLSCSINGGIFFCSPPGLLPWRRCSYLRACARCMRPWRAVSRRKYLSGLEERLRKLRVDVIEFGKLIEEAQAEPNFCQALGYFEEECRDLSSKTKVESELKVFKDVVCCGVKCLEEVILVKSVAGLVGEGGVDLEMGRPGRDDEEMIKRAVSIVREGESGEFLSLGALVYCMDGMLKESKEIEKGIKEVVQWEKNLNTIVCKLGALKKSVTVEMAIHI